MNKMTLILVLLALHIPKTYADKQFINRSNRCESVLSGNNQELSVYFQAIEQDDLKTLSTFSNLGLGVDAQHEARILLSYAAQKGKPESIKALILKTGIDVNAKDEDGWTALHHAVLNPNILSKTNTIYTLIQLEADPYITNNLGHRPSEYAIPNRYPTIITHEQRYKAIYVALALNDDILEAAELLQINYGLLSNLVRDFETNGNLTVH